MKFVTLMALILTSLTFSNAFGGETSGSITCLNDKRSKEPVKGSDETARPTPSKGKKGGAF